MVIDVMKNTTMLEPSGVLIVNKHAGATSHDIVNKVRRLYNTKRVGHAGTLDPMATGVLVVLVGRAAKASEYAHTADKSYRAILKLGLVSDTEDITGECRETNAPIPDEQTVIDACKSMLGRSMQTPPMYSAIKKDGKKLYELAREGVSVEREAREIEVYSIAAEKIADDEYVIDCKVSKGTYIRTLCTDIGEKCGCGAVMASLERTSAGGFDITEAHTIEELCELDYDALISLLHPTEQLFSDYPIVALDDFFYKLCYSGCEIYQKKIRTTHPVGQYVRLYSKDGFFGLGRVREYESGTAIKCEKLFVL